MVLHQRQTARGIMSYHPVTHCSRVYAGIERILFERWNRKDQCDTMYTAAEA